MLQGENACLGQIRFRAVKEAMTEAGLQYDSDDDRSILIWYDSLKDIDFFSLLKPWQVINRIPNINVLCRKVPFSWVLKRAFKLWPKDFQFVPQTFILPQQADRFKKEFESKRKTYIIKPDEGSLGIGIYFLNPNEDFRIRPESAIAQEYIESYTINKRKFDLRLYCLVSSVIPLSIYLYHDGLGRFCSEDADVDSDCARLTNVTMNRANPEMEISQISQIISELFPRIEAEGVDINALWHRIEDAVGLTIIASYPFIRAGVEWQCPSIGFEYSRCFQILGFDILLDKQLNPHVLEVNYRPSLDYYRGIERRMKVKMIQQALQIAVPLTKAQIALLGHSFGWNKDSWEGYLQAHPEIIKDAREKSKEALEHSNYFKIWPSSDPSRSHWKKVLETLDEMPLEPIPGFHPPPNAEYVPYQPDDEI